MGIFDFLFGKKDKPETGREQKSGEKTVRIDPSLLEKVEVESGLLVSRAFADHWDEMKLPCPAAMITTAVSSDLALEQSKFGHYPYMPFDFDYPRDAGGNWMYPLAQLNFSEIPALPGYPVSGYLQFYISCVDDLYGMDHKNRQQQTNFRVLFFEEEEIKQYKADFSFLDETMQSDMLPLSKSYALSFQPKEEFVSVEDARYRRFASRDVYEVAAKYPGTQDKLIQEAFGDFVSAGHKIGGYAAFTQYDPREDKPELEQFVQLLQIDSDDDIMWGDMGIAHFFIHPDDLAKKDFSKVLYTWDCS